MMFRAVGVIDFFIVLRQLVCTVDNIISFALTICSKDDEAFHEEN